MKCTTLLFAAVLCLHLTAALAQDPQGNDAAKAPLHDGRAVLELDPAERAMILDEMRLFLDGLQKMTHALGKQDMQATADAARGMGMKMVHEVRPELRAKLPLEFRQLGFSVHREFDQMAMDADSLKDVSYSLNQLSATLQQCVSCHATYQIRTPGSDARN